MYHPRRQHVTAGGEDLRQFGAQKPWPLSHRDPALQQESPDLIDDAGALADQTRSHPVQRLQVELLRRLRGNEFHRRALYRLGDRFAVAEVILMSFQICSDVFRRHQSRIVTLRLQLAT